MQSPYALALHHSPLSRAGSREEEQAARDARTEAPLDRLVCSSSQSVMRPLRFFVSWSGVVVLAYEGFSPALELLKHQLNSSFHSLPPENPGPRGEGVGHAFTSFLCGVRVEGGGGKGHRGIELGYYKSQVR
jgi:hypothetical protein